MLIDENFCSLPAPDVSAQFQIPRTAEISKEAERQINDAAGLLASPRSLDNSNFKGKTLTSQENETLDLVEQLKKILENDRQALAKINAAGLSTQDLGGKNVGKAGVGPLKGCEILARTEESAILLKGKSLYIYSLKKLDLEPTATLRPGQKIDLSWAHGKEKATIRGHAQENKKTHTRQIERTGGNR